MLNGRTIFDEPHHESLELLAIDALTKGDAVTAFRLADRRCRISPLPEAHSHVLRAEASFRIGNQDAAISDIASALRLDPQDIAANRRMLMWTEGASQRRAAQALIRRDYDLEVLRRAIEVLRRDGDVAFANVTVLDDAIEGWAAWEPKGPLEVTIEDGIDRITALVEPDLDHPFHDIAHAADFRLLRPKSANPHLIMLSVACRMFYSVQAPANQRASIEWCEKPFARAAHDQRVTVIVPVYADYKATKACLESLMNALEGAPHHHVVLVNDATPDRRLASYLAKMARRPSVELLTNDRNLGFVGAVNRALDHVRDGDVVLLNADTIVPLGFIERLAAAARLSPDIGTVMPLSNNGDLAGFPLRNTSSSLGSFEAIQVVDQIAAEVNADRIVDIPNGIGFCLYVTRRCLNAVGILSEDFDRGYLEDVDFCLRAREHGFRNVCAPFIYVGHAGSRSFGLEKRSLVVRNLAVLEGRFPKYGLEYASHDLLDPLRPCRAAIERRAPPSVNRARLLVTGTGAVGTVTSARACELGRSARPAIIMELRHGPFGPCVNIKDASGGVPQSMQFTLSTAAERGSLHEYLRKLQLSSIEILDPAKVPSSLVNLIFDLKIPYDIFIADAGLFEDARPLSLGALQSIPIPRERAGAESASSGDQGTTGRRCVELAESAERILVSCEHAEVFAKGLLPEWGLPRLAPASPQLHRRVKRVRKSTVARLGLVLLRGSVEEQWLIGHIAHALQALRPDVSLTVIGATIDDLGLMRVGDVFVTGAVPPEEFKSVVESYDLQSLFVTVSRPIFGHPIWIRCLECPLPLAFFDWSMGHAMAQERDLMLDPRSSLSNIVAALGRWLPAT